MVTGIPNSTFTIIELIVVLGILAILAVVSIPIHIKPCSASEQTICNGSLWGIEHAFNEMALGRTMLSTHSCPLAGSRISGCLLGAMSPLYPASGTYTTGTTTLGLPTCKTPSHTLQNATSSPEICTASVDWEVRRS